jgi:AcrR family transcriptional regulator
MARTQGSHSDITGPRLRQAALRLIARHGYAAVSMRQIAAETGVQAGALYRYIPDKQTLLFDLMQDHMAQLLDAAAALPRAGDPLQRLDDFTRFHIRFHLPRGDQVFVAYMELRNLTPAHFAQVEQMRRHYESHLDDILRDGAAAGLFQISDPRVATMAIIAMLTGLSHWYRAEGRLCLTEIEQIYVGLVRRALGSQPSGNSA